MSRPHAILALILAALVAGATPAEPAFKWPWEVQRVRRHQHRSAGERVRQLPPVDCEQIREAAKTLGPDRVRNRLNRSDARQKKTIEDCLGGRP